LIAEPPLQKKHNDYPIQSHKAECGALHKKQENSYEQSEGDVQDHPDMFEHFTDMLNIHVLEVVYLTLRQL